MRTSDRLTEPAGPTGPTLAIPIPADGVTVSFPTNVDLRRDVMTDAMWIHLGKFVADLAAHTRRQQSAANERTADAERT